MTNLRILLIVLALLAAAPAHARELTLRDLVTRADAVVLARVDDPPTSVTDTPVGHGAPAYPRYRRHLVLVDTLKGKVPAKLDVDEPAWRTRLKAHARCRGEHKCAPINGDEYQGDLAREPVPGDVVLVFLHRTAQADWELAAERSMDRAEKAAEARAVLAESGRSHR